MEGDKILKIITHSYIIFQSTPSAWRVTVLKLGRELELEKFQSTPSAWRVTWWAGLMIPPGIISIHTLRMEGDDSGLSCHSGHQISIHTLRMEGDGIPMMRFGVASLFQSTPSAWRVTLTGPGSQLPAGISIHTLRMEGDSCGRSPLLPGPYFNPHPPHGG